MSLAQILPIIRNALPSRQTSVLTLNITTEIFNTLSNLNLELQLIFIKLFSIGKYSKMHLTYK